MAQGVHCALEEAPGKEEKVPAGQVSHAEGALENVPAGQFPDENAQVEC